MTARFASGEDNLFREKVVADVQALEVRRAALARHGIREAGASTVHEQFDPVLLKEVVPCFGIEEPHLVHEHGERLSEGIQPFQEAVAPRERRIEDSP